MQNKGTVRLFAIIFGLICLYYLSFTWVSKSIDKQADKIQDKVEKKAFLDSLKVNYLVTDYTYKEVKDRSINLGLDLKGGINATLEVSVKDILKGLANNSKDPLFNEALEAATEMQKDDSGAYFDLFVKAFTAKGGKLGDPKVFGNKALSDVINFKMTNEEIAPVLRQQVDASIGTAFKVLRNRIDRFGVTQPNIQRIGKTGRILIELPGAKDIDRVKTLLTGTAKLQFWEAYTNQELFNFLLQANQKLATIVKPEDVAKEDVAKEKDSTDSAVDKLLDGEKDKETLRAENPLFTVLSINQSQASPVLGTSRVIDTATVNSYLRKKEIRSLLPSELRYAKFVWDLPAKDSEIVNLYALKGNRNGVAPIEGDVISNARQTFSQLGASPEISMTMKGSATKKWAKMTENNVGKFVAVVLDNSVYTAPRVNGKIPNGRTSITGQFSIEEAQDVANALQSGKLPAAAHIIQAEIVGPSLGQEAIDSGIMSFILALALILLWMIFYYGKAGIFTDIALIINMLFIFGVLTAFGAVLTLPGIAGIVLTIGMSVDANVLIYERIKEELAGGKALKEAVADGYKHSLPSILDANITTFLTGLILFSFGSGPIKGFAYTLMVGIATSLFSAIYVSRLFVDWYISKGKELTFNTNITKNWFQNINIDFLRKRKLTYVISGALVLAGLVSLFTQGLNYGVDFKGGRTYTVRFAQDVNSADIASTLKDAFGGSLPDVKTYGSTNQLKITTNYKIEDNDIKVDDEIQEILFKNLQKYLPEGTKYKNFKVGSQEQTVGVMETMQVGPTIADDIKKDALGAVFGSLFIVFMYILFRFRKWQFSLGAVVAVFHDVLIVLGIFSLLYKFLPFEEINQSFIAAILTVVGYSLNDTVVIFDRIREYANDHDNWVLSKIVNKALSSTLGRTINTSLTTLVTLLAIFLFGGDSIKGFMFAMIIGVLVGTYSSLFIATPIMYDTVMKGSKTLKKESKEEA
jgi:SecD/SecF fusion protein